MKKKIAFFILRVGLGVVFLIFGIGKLQGDIWAQTMSTMDFFKNLPWDVNISIYGVGILEILTGIFLIIGLFVRIAASVAALQLIGILILLQFQEIRDIGLLGAAVFLSVRRDDSFGIGWVIKEIRRKQNAA
ncbi:MAG: DoxX family protein [Candidatus Omnitrophota bacterium]|nr:MAG: DoxX family protein [Candidatus Omnitrophota bacterium]